MFARAPASSANLGPGFDTLAVALSLYVEVSLELTPTFSISSEGCGAGMCDDESHLAAVVAERVLGHRQFRIHVNSQIPVARGLGSSAALALAAAAAAGADDPLAVAARADGHAENAAASMFGGLVVAGLDRYGRPHAHPLQLDGVWRFVVVVPDQELSTPAARSVLPDQVPFADAVHNLGALGFLIAGLAHREQFTPEAMDDRLHQPYRSALLPVAEPLLAELRRAGAAGSCWSGSGSSVLGLVTPETADAVATAAGDFLERESVAGQVLTLEADRTGLVTR